MKQNKYCIGCPFVKPKWMCEKDGLLDKKLVVVFCYHHPKEPHNANR